MDDAEEHTLDGANRDVLEETAGPSTVPEPESPRIP